MVALKDPLVLDLVEWIAKAPRLYSEVIETWRTSCPRLTIGEDAVDRGYVVREAVAGGTIVTVTEDGKKFLRANGRSSPSPLVGEGA
jgi:CTP-dependent riboflavin kinase